MIMKAVIVYPWDNGLGENATRTKYFDTIEEAQLWILEHVDKKIQGIQWNITETEDDEVAV